MVVLLGLSAAARAWWTPLAVGCILRQALFGAVRLDLSFMLHCLVFSDPLIPLKPAPIGYNLLRIRQDESFVFSFLLAVNLNLRTQNKRGFETFGACCKDFDGDAANLSFSTLV